MAVIECIELTRGRDGDFNVRQRARRYTRHFKVRTNDNLDGPATVQAYLSLPALYSSYTSGNDVDTAALVESVRVSEAGYRLWDAEVTYSTVTPDSGQNAENPLDRNPVVRWSYSAYQTAVSEDLDGNATLNSTGDPFDPPIEREEKRPVLAVERYESLFSPALALQYQYAVNSDTFMGAEPGYARCNAMEAERHYEKGVYCWRVRYEFEFRRESFLARVLDQGFRYLKANGDPDLIRVDGSPVSSPVLLNGSGGVLSSSKGVLDADIGAADVQLDLSAASTFGTNVPIIVEIDDEKILVATVQNGIGRLSGLTRGYGGTTAAAHTAGATVQQAPYYYEFVIHKSLPFAALGITI